MKYLKTFFQVLVKEIDNPNSPVGIRSAMHNVIALGNEAGMGNGSSKAGNATCVLLAKEGCVKALLKQCNPPVQKCQDVRMKRSVKHKTARMFKIPKYNNP